MHANTKATHRRQAIRSALITAALQFCSAAELFWVRQNCLPDGIWGTVLLVLALGNLLILIPLAFSLKGRLHEIEGGELDEARQY